MVTSTQSVRYVSEDFSDSPDLAHTLVEYHQRTSADTIWRISHLEQKNSPCPIPDTQIYKM